MSWSLPYGESQQEFVSDVERLSAQRVADCYQCGKCTAGCPTAFVMDYPPNQIMRGIQLGMRDAVLASIAIWVCASCQTCTTRCPQGVDTARVIDVLRNLAYAQGIKAPEQEVHLFHRVFLGNVRQFGRVFEIGMMATYNLLSGHLLKDIVMAPKLILKGKLALLPSRTGNKGVKQLFARIKEVEARQS